MSLSGEALDADGRQCGYGVNVCQCAIPFSRYCTAAAAAAHSHTNFVCPTRFIPATFRKLAGSDEGTRVLHELRTPHIGGEVCVIGWEQVYVGTVDEPCLRCANLCEVFDGFGKKLRPAKRIHELDPSAWLTIHRQGLATPRRSGPRNPLCAHSSAILSGCRNNRRFES